MAEQRERYAEQLLELQAGSTTAGKSALAKLHAMVSQEPASSSTAVARDRGAQEAQARYQAEASKTQKALEHLRALHEEQQEALSTCRSQLRAEEAAKESLRAEYEERVSDL